jgi:hypothetical protein
LLQQTGKGMKDSDSDSGSANAPGTTPEPSAEGVVGAGHPERTPAALRDLRKSKVNGRRLCRMGGFMMGGLGRSEQHSSAALMAYRPEHRRLRPTASPCLTCCPPLVLLIFVCLLHRSGVL